MGNILDLLQNIDKKQLSEAVRKAKEFSRTQDGKAFIEKLKKGEGMDSIPVNETQRKQISDEIKNNPELVKQLNGLFGEED